MKPICLIILLCCIILIGCKPDEIEESGLGNQDTIKVRTFLFDVMTGPHPETGYWFMESRDTVTDSNFYVGFKFHMIDEPPFHQDNWVIKYEMYLRILKYTPSGGWQLMKLIKEEVIDSLHAYEIQRVYDGYYDAEYVSSAENQYRLSYYFGFTFNLEYTPPDPFINVVYKYFDYHVYFTME